MVAMRAELEALAAGAARKVATGMVAAVRAAAVARAAMKAEKMAEVHWEAEVEVWVD